MPGDGPHADYLGVDMPESTAPNGASAPLHPASVAVATWWADKAGTIGDTGDRSRGGGLTMALAVVAGAQGRAADPSKREAFIDALACRVTAELERRADRPHWSVTVGVDYGPDGMLADAADEAGIPGGAFPWKTMTWTYPTHVVTSLGYGGRDQLVWQADDWQRPVCEAGKYGDGPNYDRQPWKCSALRYHDSDHVFDTPDPLCVAEIRNYDGTPITCNRPAGGDWHEMTDGFAAPMLHDFKAGV